jgi:hypothetical protein
LLATGFALLLPVAALSATEQARADALPSNCAASGATVTCTYNSGSEGTFTVPIAVSSIHVVATGAGGHTTFAGPGGPGAQVTADLSVTPGSTLYAEVDIGGGPGGADAAAGGGESDLRTCSVTDNNTTRDRPGPNSGRGGHAKFEADSRQSGSEPNRPVNSS